ncbi:lysine specific demethylase 8 [Echinococcus multilocularis]|uniref:Lysine specific demethylase 8 n=1 Tax=Echinococcus multilocularis TaxID=6211 RepID=A0A068Y6F8_ECHMU|nr:lysine specific demethylase 8 [Echinococcus multilocularis]
MDWFLPPSITQKMDVDTTCLFRNSTLLLCSNVEAERTTRDIVFELLLNVANRAALEGRSVSYFRPCELVCLSQFHVHGAPACDFNAWDSIRFFYPTESSLVRFFSQIHLAKRLPDLIVIEQLDRIIGHHREDFLARLYALTCLFTDALEHIHQQRSSQNSGAGCRLLVSCFLPQTLWSGQSTIPRYLVPHGLHQACLFTKEDDESHFSLADFTGAFKFRLLLREREIFFTSFLYDTNLLTLVQRKNN